MDEFIDSLMKDFGHPGPIKVRELRDPRKDPKDDEREKKALEEIHPDMPFIEASFDQRNIGNGNTYYMRVNGRWVFLDSLKVLFEVERAKDSSK